jgi:hypothetical protein
MVWPHAHKAISGRAEDILPMLTKAPITAHIQNNMEYLQDKYFKLLCEFERCHKLSDSNKLQLTKRLPRAQSSP